MEEKAEKYAFQVCRKPQEVSIDALFAVMERLDVRVNTLYQDVLWCYKYPAEFFEKNRKQYAKYGMVHMGSLDWMRWIGMLVILERQRYICTIPADTKSSDFLFGLNHNLQVVVKGGMQLNPRMFDQNAPVLVMAGCVNKRWYYRYHKLLVRFQTMSDSVTVGVVSV